MSSAGPVESSPSAAVPGDSGAPPAPPGREDDRLGRLVGRWWFWVAFVLVAFSWPIVRAVTTELPPPLPVLATVPEFTLTSQHGKPFGSEDLRGRVWLAGFVFTRCPTVCPALTTHMVGIQRRARHLQDAFYLVSFSVDPDYDTPEVLAEYARLMRAKDANWAFLTGPTADMQRVVKDGMKIAMEGAGPDAKPEEVVHGTYLVLVDQQLRIRGYYDSSDPERVDQLLRDAGMLANRRN
jgi:protein SCO1/2